MKYGAAVTLFAFFARLAVGQTGTVTLTNDFHPWAQLEEGDYFTVSIQGAAHIQTVTVVEDGVSPYVFGQTDDTGSWQISGTQTSQFAGYTYTQQWYVGGVQVYPAT